MLVSLGLLKVFNPELLKTLFADPTKAMNSGAYNNPLCFYSG
jgi:hypothetical protein